MEKSYRLMEFSKSTYNHHSPDSSNKFTISHNDLYLVYKDQPKSIEIVRMDHQGRKISNVTMEFISIDTNFVTQSQLKCAVKKNLVGFKYYNPQSFQNPRTVVKIQVKFQDELICRQFVDVISQYLTFAAVSNNKETSLIRDSSILEESVLSQSNPSIISTSELSSIEAILSNKVEETDTEDVTYESIQKLLNDPSFIEYMKKVENVLLQNASLGQMKN